MKKYFTHPIILTLVPAVFMSVIAGVCLLLVAQWPAVFSWVIIVSLLGAAACPLLAMLALLRIKRVKISLSDLIVCALGSLLAAVLFNIALKSGIHAISGHRLSAAAARMLWLNLIGWVMGLFGFARFVSALATDIS
jgi:hypothetical protein